MKNLYTTTKILFAALLLIASCQRKPDDFRKYLDGERVYPGAIANEAVAPGDGRLLLTWNPSPDPSVTKYVVYWNNNADSVVVNATSHNPQDTVKCIINNLAEYTYTFFINSFDAAGNKSVVKEISNARVYGSIYKRGLYNRLPNPAGLYTYYADGSVRLNFIAPDTINIATVITYRNAANEEKKVNLLPEQSFIVLPSYKTGSPILYQSSYIPRRDAIDTFYTLAADTFATINTVVQCSKSIFAELSLPGDAGVYDQNGSRVSRLWDGSTSPNGWPDVYHSDGTNLPMAFSFDMGNVYNNLYEFEEIGRNCCHNPTNFEVWGIAALPANPATAHPSQDVAGWKQDMLDAGWVLLGQYTRSNSNDARDPMKFRFVDNPPPVRYIRIRVHSVASGSNNSVNMTQLTFWNKM